MSVGVPEAGKTILCVPVVANVVTERGQTLVREGYELRLLSLAYQQFVESSHDRLTTSHADPLQEILSGGPRSCRPLDG